MTNLKVGFFTIGLDVYWEQFEGLKPRLLDYAEKVAALIKAPGVDLVDLSLIDNAADALRVGHLFRAADVDVIFLYAATYALSSTVLPVVRRANVPVVILNLTPGPAIDYAAFNALPDRRSMTGEWLAWCGSCPVPEISNVFRRVGVPFYQITGYINDPEVAKEICAWVSAAKAKYALEHNRLGLIGNYYGGMLDIYTDLTQINASFGGHIEIVEVEELAEIRRGVSKIEAAAKVDEFFEKMDVRSDCTVAELERAARTAVALDRLVEKHDLTSMAYYHKGIGSEEHEDVMSSVILGTSLLTARGIPVAGEFEIKNSIAMKIMDSLGAGGSFTEYYGVDFIDDIVLMGHDGPGHIAIGEGKTKVKPLEVYHGKAGRGLSVEMSVRHGPVTLLSVIEGSGSKMSLLSSEATSVPGPIFEIGNTNSRYRFQRGAKSFIENWNSHGPAHHCAVGIGHIAETLDKLAALLMIDHQQCS